MKNRGIEHSDNWATPKVFYDALNAEFGFDFDPCPLNSEFDGLQIEWGGGEFCEPAIFTDLENCICSESN